MENFKLIMISIGIILFYVLVIALIRTIFKGERILLKAIIFVLATAFVIVSLFDLGVIPSSHAWIEYAPAFLIAILLIMGARNPDFLDEVYEKYIKPVVEKAPVIATVAFGIAVLSAYAIPLMAWRGGFSIPMIAINYAKIVIVLIGLLSGGLGGVCYIWVLIMSFHNDNEEEQKFFTPIYIVILFLLSIVVCAIIFGVQMGIIAGCLTAAYFATVILLGLFTIEKNGELHFRFTLLFIISLIASEYLLFAYKPV